MIVNVAKYFFTDHKADIDKLLKKDFYTELFIRSVKLAGNISAN